MSIELTDAELASPAAGSKPPKLRLRVPTAARRLLVLATAGALIALPGATLAQDPSPSAAPSFEMAPGVSVQALALIEGPGVPSGQDAPGVFRFRFEPGASVDLSGQPEVSLVTIESGTLVATTDVDLTIHAPGDPSGAGTLANAGSDATLRQGDYFIVPPRGAGHVRNDGSTEATMAVASLLVTTPAGPAAAASEAPKS